MVTLVVEGLGVGLGLGILAWAYWLEHVSCSLGTVRRWRKGVMAAVVVEWSGEWADD